MVEALGREFERASGNKLDLIFNTAGSLRDRVKNGESADLVILSESIIASLDKSGMFVPGSIINLGRTVTGVAVRGKRGAEVAASIAEGRAEIGTTFISEVLPVKGVKVIGPLPGELHTANTYTAAIPAGSASRSAATALLRALTDPATRARWTAAGLEPAF